MEPWRPFGVPLLLIGWLARRTPPETLSRGLWRSPLATQRFDSSNWGRHSTLPWGVFLLSSEPLGSWSPNLRWRAPGMPSYLLQHLGWRSGRVQWPGLAGNFSEWSSIGRSRRSCEVSWPRPFLLGSLLYLGKLLRVVVGTLEFPLLLLSPDPARPLNLQPLLLPCKDLLCHEDFFAVWSHLVHLDLLLQTLHHLLTELIGVLLSFLRESM